MVKPRILAKCHQLAEQHRLVKGWKPGSIFSRSMDSSKPNEGDLYIYQQIGSDWWTGEGVTAASVQQALDAMKGVKTLNVYINSEGGDVFEAKAIYAQLQRFPAEKVVCVDGIAASAATFIAMVGDRIVTSEVGTWMVHEAWGGAMGNASDLRGYADLLDMMNDDIATLYAKQTGKSVEEMRSVMSAETWMNAQQALEMGFTDEIASDAESDGTDTEAKATFKPVVAAGVTQRLLNASQADLLAFKARRAGAQMRPEESKNIEPVRASPAKRVQSASR
jgi:ATP-dependent Clp protease protease subunit